MVEKKDRKKKKRNPNDPKICRHCSIGFTSSFNKCITCGQKLTWREAEDICNNENV